MSIVDSNLNFNVRKSVYKRYLSSTPVLHFVDLNTLCLDQCRTPNLTDSKSFSDLEIDSVIQIHSMTVHICRSRIQILTSYHFN